MSPTFIFHIVHFVYNMYKNQLVKTVCTKMSLKGEEEFIPESIAEVIFNNVTLFIFKNY